MTTIIDIKPGTFGGALRNGDMIGVANVVEYLRKIRKDPTIKFNIIQEWPGISSEKYCQDFYQFLLNATDYFTILPGQETLPWRRVNLWDFRDISGDLVKIPNKVEMKKKIVVFPLFDAPYNTYRNWPNILYEDILDKYSTNEYHDYEKIICVKDRHNRPDYKEWKYSHEFMDNIHHIQEAEIFVGGDTGTSHFAWALDRGPAELIYYNSSRGLVHTLPFYLIQGKGKLNTYWLDFESTQWQ